jgi:hypothetical protein
MRKHLKTNKEYFMGKPAIELKVIKGELYVIEDGKKRKIKSATKEMLEAIKKEGEQ